MYKLNKIESWNDITVNQFIELSSIEENLSYYDRCITIFSIINDTDSESFDNITFTEMGNLMESLSWMSIQPDINFKKTINNLHYKDINQSTLGDFIDINHFLDTPINNLKEICSIMYRKYVLDKFGNKEFMYSTLENKDMFGEIPISDVFGILKVVLDYKKLITESYDKHFNPVIEDNDEEYMDEEDKEAEELDKVANNWAWETLLYKLSNGDITKYDSILNYSLIFVMNHLSHLKDMKL